jgi:hypothetical protein
MGGIMSNKPILITGGTGFLGSALAFDLLSSQQSVVVFSRQADTVARTFGDKVQAITHIDQLPDAGCFKAIINLAGAGIFDQRWSDARKAVLRESRINLTKQLADWIFQSAQKPEVFISGSAIGVYGDHGDEVLDETSLAVSDFSQQLCADWESAALMVQTCGVRVGIVRTGLVLGRGGGLLQRMLLPFRFGLGGKLGNGQQWMSWIHMQDWLGIVKLMLEDQGMQGAYNATAPSPVTNQSFSASLAEVLNRPMLLPLPEFMLRLLLGEMADLVLGSQRVLPQRLLEKGFHFKFSQLDPALRNLLLAG